MANLLLPKKWYEILLLRAEYEGYARGYDAGFNRQPPDVLEEHLETLRAVKRCGVCSGDGTMDHWDEIVVCPGCGGTGVEPPKVPK
jgi:hypothetical protein